MQTQARSNSLENDVDLLNIDAAAKRLCMSTRNLWLLTHSGQVPHIRLGRLVRFLPRDIDTYIQLHRIGG